MYGRRRCPDRYNSRSLPITLYTWWSLYERSTRAGGDLSVADRGQALSKMCCYKLGRFKVDESNHGILSIICHETPLSFSLCGPERATCMKEKRNGESD